MSDLEQHFVVAFEDSFDARYGLEYLSPTHGRVTITPEHLGADGTVQSGIYAAIAESIASTGTAVEVVPDGSVPVGAEQLDARRRRRRARACSRRGRVAARRPRASGCGTSRSARPAAP